MANGTRNISCVPELDSEGVFLKPLDVVSEEKWAQRNLLKPFERMHTHHTLASARRFYFFRPYSHVRLPPKKSGQRPNALDVLTNLSEPSIYLKVPYTGDTFLPSCHHVSNLIPRDELDFVLSSPYDHSFEIFPDTIDVYLQPETMGKSTWRRLRNTSDLKLSQDSRAGIPVKAKRAMSAQEIPYRINKAHPVIVSGIVERRHPSNVKLMNSSHHSPQTNAGYSRQDSDGNCYQY